MLVAIMTLVFFWRRNMMWNKFSVAVTFIATLASAISLVVGFVNVDNWSGSINQKLYDNPIAFEQTTKYQNIVITRGPHPSNPRDNNWELFLNGNKQFSSVDEKIYHEYLVHPAMSMAAKHKSVLILGGGDGMALREVLKYKDVKEVTLVDLDPDMIKLARNNPIMRKLNHNAFADARVRSSLNTPALNTGVKDTGAKQDVMIEVGETKTSDCQELVNPDGHSVSRCNSEIDFQKTATVDVYTVDADLFVSERSGPFDIVIVDLPDPSSIELAKLYSQEFYAKIARLLSPYGLVVVQSTSPYHAKETYLCILRTMAAAGLNVLPYHDNVPSFGDWGWIIGSRTFDDASLYNRAKSLRSFDVETTEVTAQSMTRATIFNRGALSSQNKTVSTLMNPVVFGYYTYDAWKVD